MPYKNNLIIINEFVLLTGGAGNKMFVMKRYQLLRKKARLQYYK
ncbi:protein of unknown function [Xenorhabdus poinarii G6]|uniref:Uncharacterized protein n=1 Tax=Xenorhabdus poinarii G6 TaxID=1354304 RepID=A0A068R152_9GAMM|nr:protein of unknown function [Xenorhabdus poinarii G6]